MSIVFSTQLFLGAEEKKSFSSADIKDKIARTKGNLDLKKLMIWDVNPSGLTKEIVDFCKKEKIETYLWHPVLADMNNIDVTTENMGQIPYIHDLQQLSGIWNKIGFGEENFLFIDPVNDVQNNENYENFTKVMRECDFDGIFLDRVRYPSPVNGFESIFSTFFSSYTSYCINQNIDLQGEKSKISRFYKEIGRWDDSKLDNFNDFEEILEDFSSFFQYKKNQIYQKVKLYNQWAAKNGKKVGLDLLSSGFSFFTGQDYSLLSTECDWIKDMTYCYGMGPAALPLEIICLTNGFRKLSPKISEKSFLKFLGRHMGLELPDNVLQIQKNGLDPINALLEIKKANRIIENKVPVYNGIEIVNSSYFSTNITEKMVDAYMDYLVEDAAGIVASWNILHIPDKHFKALVRRLQ